MPYEALAIANHFLDLASEGGVALSPMKIQKLVYYAHGWHLGLTGRPLLDEDVQAWSFGPVVRSVYNGFREFGSGDITEKGQEWESSGGTWLAGQLRTPSIDDSKALDGEFVKKLLAKVWEVYRNFSAIQLSNMTHMPGTSWHRVLEKYGGRIPKYATIPNEWIREEFTPKKDRESR